MTGPGNWKPQRGLGDIMLSLLVALSVAFTMLIAIAFARQTMDKVRDLDTATSDNVQWTLPQVEVEFLVFLNALETQSHSPTPDLDDVRLRYDIFYSRVDTLSHSQVFRQLSGRANFLNSLTTVRDFITSALPRIDGPDPDLIASLPDIRKAARDIRPAVRSLSISGLAYFAEQTDLRRQEMSATLTGLAFVSGFLFVALAMLSVFLFFVYRKADAKSMDLAQANARMNTILSTSLDGVIVTDKKGRVQEFNTAAADIFGYTQEHVQGREIGALLVPDHLRDAHEAGMRRMRQGGDRHVTGKGRVQMEALHADQSVFPIELALQSAFDGRQELFIGFVRDISERITSQSELVAARDRALAGERAKAEFLTVMSHEIRTPLNGLLGNLSLLQETRLDPQQSEFIRNMDISGKILIGHVDTILDISTLEAGKLDLAQDPTNLNKLLQDLIDAQRSIAETHGSTLGWRWVGTATEWVTTDSKRLVQVLLNLVGNAIKFTENGHILIEIERLSPPDPKAFGPHLVEFRISDTGIGIAQHELGNVFEDFQTNDASFRRATNGTGLGLGISRRLVQAMGGEIGVESILGEGSTFWVRLPFASAQAPNGQVTSDQAPIAPAALNVLVVEDNEINQQVARSMLEREGHQVSCAFDGKSGVGMADNVHFDLILMDVSMPIMDGLEATHLIRSGGGRSASSQIVALSANVLPQDQDRYFEAGMDGFLSKPLTLNDLRNMLAGLKTAPAKPDNAPVILDQEQLDEMRDSLGQTALSGMVLRFVDETNAVMTCLKAAQPDDLPALAAQCHKIAGSAAVFGVNALRQALQQQEQAAKIGDIDALHTNMPTVAMIWDQTRSAITNAGIRD